MTNWRWPLILDCISALYFVLVIVAAIMISKNFPEEWRILLRCVSCLDMPQKQKMKFSEGEHYYFYKNNTHKEKTASAMLHRRKIQGMCLWSMDGYIFYSEGGNKRNYDFFVRIKSIWSDFLSMNHDLKNRGGREEIKIVHTQKYTNTLKADKSHKRSLLPAKNILFITRLYTLWHFWIAH